MPSLLQSLHWLESQQFFLIPNTVNEKQKLFTYELTETFYYYIPQNFYVGLI